MATEKIECVLDDVDEEEIPVYIVDIEQGNLEHREDLASAPDAPVDNVDERIYGSFKQAFIIDTFISYASRSSMFAVTSPATRMKGLSPTLKCLLVSSPLLSNMLTIIPMNWRVNRSGGKGESIVLIGLSTLGMITITTLSTIVDLQTINSFDWRYGLMIGAGFLIGCSAGTLQLISDALKWTPKKEYIPNLQLLYSFLVDSAAVTTPLAVYFLSDFGFYIPLAIYTAMSLFSGLLTCSMVYPSPYYQFKTRFPNDKAKELAIKSGQLTELIKDYDKVTFWNVLLENLTVLNDRRSLLLGFSVFSSLGNVFIFKTILPNLLMGGFGLTLNEAVVTSALATLTSLVTRPITSKMILKWDSDSGGIKFHLLGCGLTFSGAMALATVSKLPQWGLYLSLACTSIGYGINMVTPLSIAVKWSKPVGSNLKEINPSTMFNLFGTIGSLGGLLLPLLLSLLVDQRGTSWYSQYFYIIIGMMMISAIGTPIVNYQVKHRQDESCFRSTLSFFRNETVTNNQTRRAAPAFLNAPDLSVTPSSLEVLDDEFFVNAIL